MMSPILRTLIVPAFIITLGRGVFLTLTVLYFTLIVGISAFEVAAILTVASAVGVVFSLIGGMLADRFSARRLFALAEVIAGAALACYTFVDAVWSIVLVASIFSAANATAGSVRSAIVARAFVGAERVGARAVLRTVTNVGIAIGGAAAGVVLLLDDASAYRVIMVIGGLVTALSAVPLMRLPASVDAVPRAAGQTPAGVSPLRDRRYLALTVLSAVFGLHFGLADIGIPLWIAANPHVPVVMVSIVLIINTTIVIALQIPLSRGTHDVRTAGRVIALSGILMALACFGYAAAGGVSIWFAITFLVLAALAHVFAEILSSAGTWGLSFELAEPDRAGAYQGVFGMGFSLSSMAAPLIITAAVTNGALGWAMLALLFLASATGLWWIARRAAPSHA